MSTAPTVNTQYGPVSGLDKDGILRFRGIPYAAPPVGERRFKKPLPPEPWSEVRVCQQFGLSPIQQNVAFFGMGETGEDCLSLNVWTPGIEGTKRPVMVWIHGGAYVAGSSAQLIYKAEKLCRQTQCVLVSINYRLGALGLLYLQDVLSNTDSTDTNLCLRDQIAALQWVRENIAHFGGDPERVTVLGESAGAMSVGMLMASPLARGLFQQSVLQSGAADHVMDKKDATRVAQTFLRALGVEPDNNPERLWQATPDEILQAQNQCFKTTVTRGRHPHSIPQFGMPVIPVVGDDVLPDYPMTLLEQGAARDIPALIGTTREEWDFFLKAPQPDGSSPAQKLKGMARDKLVKVLERSLPGWGEQAADHYLASPQRQQRPSLYETLVDFESDRMFRIPAIAMAEAQCRHQSRTYLFVLTFDKGPFGACHAVDVPLLFGDVEQSFGQFLTGGGEPALKMSGMIQEAWGQFVHSGNPTTQATGEWRPYNTNDRPTMILDLECELEPDFMGHERAFWAEIF